MRTKFFLLIVLSLFLALDSANAQQTFTVKGKIDVSLSGYEMGWGQVWAFDSHLRYLTGSSFSARDNSFQFQLAPGNYYLVFWVGLSGNNSNALHLTYYVDGGTKRLKSTSEAYLSWQGTNLTPLSVSDDMDLGTLTRDASTDVVNISGSIEMPFDINPGGRSYDLDISLERQYNSFSYYQNLYGEIARGQILKFNGLIEKGTYDWGTITITEGCGQDTTYDGIVYQVYLKQTEAGWQGTSQNIKSEFDFTHDVSNIDLRDLPGVHTVSGKLINASGIVPLVIVSCYSDTYRDANTKTFKFTLADGGSYYLDLNTDSRSYYLAYDSTTGDYYPTDDWNNAYQFVLDKNIDFGTIDCSNIASSPPESEKSKAFFSIHREFTVASNSDKINAGLQNAQLGYGLSIYNADDDTDTLLGNIQCTVNADNITDIDYSQYAERDDDSIKWTFPSDYTIAENNWLWLGSHTNLSEEKDIPISISREMDKDSFDSDGNESVTFSISFKDTDFAYLGGMIQTSQNSLVDASIVLDSFQTDAPLYPYRPFPKKDEHGIEFNLDRSKLQPNKTYTFSAIIRVKLKSDNPSPVLYKPEVGFFVGDSRKSLGTQTGKTVAISDGALPEHIHYVSVSTNTSNTWSISSDDQLSADLSEVCRQVNLLPGDCNGDGTVSIDEIQKAINCFLGKQNACCDKSDLNSDGTVSINEVQKVINAYLEK